MSKAAKFAHSCQMTLFDLIAGKKDAEAIVMGNVVDALFADQPDLAIAIVGRSGFSRDMKQKLVDGIRKSFGLP